MTSRPSPGVTTAAAWDLAADSYEDTIEKGTGHFVSALLDRINLSGDDIVADVACGTGAVTLEAVRRGARVLAVDHSEAMVSRMQVRVAGAGFADSVEGSVGDATALDLADGHVSAAVSNFGIIFCPDVGRALRELARVTEPGGVVAVSAWTTMENNGLAHYCAMDLDALGFDVPAPAGFAWPEAGALRRDLANAGLVDIDIVELDGLPLELESWEAFGYRLGSPCFAAMLDDLTERQRAVFVDAYLEQARMTYGDGPIELTRQAWIASGHRP
jgi:SAM-dependent methyltransferase